MLLHGTFHESDGLDEPAYDIDDAIITPDRIALDWKQGDISFHAKLYSDDGYFYRGTFGENRRENAARMEANLYSSNSGDHLLWMTWYREDNGFGGVSIVHLTPKE